MKGKLQFYYRNGVGMSIAILRAVRIARSRDMA
jgi:hypothetical protein